MKNEKQQEIITTVVTACIVAILIGVSFTIMVLLVKFIKILG